MHGHSNPNGAEVMAAEGGSDAPAYLTGGLGGLTARCSSAQQLPPLWETV